LHSNYAPKDSSKISKYKADVRFCGVLYSEFIGIYQIYIIVKIMIGDLLDIIDRSLHVCITIDMKTFRQNVAK
jgi:hypothetical protein